MPVPRNKSTMMQSVFKGLNAKGYMITVRGDRLPSVNLDVALDILVCNADRTWQGLSDNPRTCPCEGAQRSTYKSWMTSADPLMRRGRVLHAHLDAGKIRSFLRFRPSCHKLPVDKGRRQARPRIPRRSRFCEHCTMNRLGTTCTWCLRVQQCEHVRDQYPHVCLHSQLARCGLSYGKMISSLLSSMLSHVWISFDDIDSDGRSLINSMRIVIIKMQNETSSGCRACVKCQVSNHKLVGGAGETDGSYCLGGQYFRRVSRHVLTCTCLRRMHLVHQFGLTLTSICFSQD
jgi:hypothetical protein